MVTTSGLTEKNWPNIILTPIAVDAQGIVTVSSTEGLKVKQLISFINAGNSQLFEIKKVFSDTQFVVGDPKKPIGSIIVPVGFDGGTANVPEQQRNTIAEGYVIRSVYEEEPTLALRTVPVDWLGNKYDAKNPFPVNVIGEGVGIKNPIIYNLPIINAGIEYSQLLPDRTAKFKVKSRNGHAVLKMAYDAGETSGDYWTIRPGTIFDIDDVLISGQTLYIQSSKSGHIVEIHVWTL